MRKNLFTILALLAISLPAFGSNTGLVYHEAVIVDEINRTVGAISTVTVYVSGTTGAATIYMDPGRSLAITQPMTTSSTNTTLADGKFYWWGPDPWDYTVSDGTNTHSNVGHTTLTASVGRIVFPSYLSSINTASFTDAESQTFGTDSDWVANGGATADRMTWIPATADTAEFWVGSTNFPANLELYGATSTYDVRWDASANAFEWDDNAIASWGDSADFTITHTGGSTTNFGGAYTSDAIATFATDVIFDGATDIKYDDSRAQLHFQDDSVLGIGGAADAVGDVTLFHDGSDFYTDAAIADEGWLIGDTTSGFDISYAFETAGAFITDYDADFIGLTDDMDMRFGTGAASNGDFQISSSSANLLTIGQIAAGTGSVAVGVDDAGLDLKLFGDTTTEYLLWDTSEDSLIGNLGNVLFTTVDAEANQWKVDATGTVAGFAAVIETTDGGVQINADGGANGDIAIDAADAVTITSAGATTFAVTGALSMGGSQISNRLTVLETVTAQTNAVAATESGAMYDVVYTGTHTTTLPQAAPGLIFTVIDGSSTAGDDVIVDIQAGDNLEGDTNGDGIQCVTDEEGSSITFVAITSTRWIVVSSTGTWGAQ